MKTYRVLVKAAEKIIPIDILADHFTPSATGNLMKLYSDKGEAYFRAEEVVAVFELTTLARTAKSS